MAVHDEPMTGTEAAGASRSLPGAFPFSMALALLIGVLPFFVAEFGVGLFMETTWEEAWSLWHNTFLDFKGHLVDPGLLGHNLQYRVNFLAFKLWGVERWQEALIHLEVARFFPIVFFFVTFWTVCRTASRFFSWQAGVVAVVILASTPVVMDQAYVLRSYSVSLMLTALLVHAFLACLDRPGAVAAMAVGLLSGLLMYSVISNVYIILSLGMLVLVLHGLEDRKAGGWRNWLSNFLLACTPWRWNASWLSGHRYLVLGAWLVLGTAFAICLYVPGMSYYGPESLLHARGTGSKGLFAGTAAPVLLQSASQFFVFRWLPMAGLALVGMTLLLRGERRPVAPRPAGGVGVRRVYVVLLTVMFGPFLLSCMRGDEPVLRYFMAGYVGWVLILGNLLGHPLASRQLSRRAQGAVLLFFVGGMYAGGMAYLDRLAHAQLLEHNGVDGAEERFMPFADGFFRPREVFASLVRDYPANMPRVVFNPITSSGMQGDKYTLRLLLMLHDMEDRERLYPGDLGRLGDAPEIVILAYHARKVMNAVRQRDPRRHCVLQNGGRTVPELLLCRLDGAK
ncbi:MAG: glycosyltransferase family 39 protein [Magnetococcales bacterium]|nr:glycosyltransferase family 39 protein [Magnetococcales bacterium]